MPKETPLQDGLHQGEVHHVQKKQAQNGQVYDDCHLHNASTVYAKIVTFPPSLTTGSKDLKMSTDKV